MSEHNERLSPRNDYASGIARAITESENQPSYNDEMEVYIKSRTVDQPYQVLFGVAIYFFGFFLNCLLMQESTSLFCVPFSATPLLQENHVFASFFFVCVFFLVWCF